jgi:ABC-type multidrug transport system fused ATPase/permease subunit
MSFSEAAVIRRSRFQDALRSTTADAVEGGLTVAGFVVAIVATLVLGFRGNPDLVTIAVVWLQSVLLWAAWRHFRRSRERLVRKLRVMLQDRVNNQLTVLVGLTDIHAHTVSEDDNQDDVEIALTAARAVSREIETLSLESLRTWEARYARHLPLPLR